MLLRTDPARQKAELEYVKDMHLNTVRLEGKLEDENFLDICDREGILALAGWCCCDHWERWRRLEERGLCSFRRIPEGPDSPPAQPRLPARLAEWQRRAACRKKWSRLTSRF